MAGSDSERRSPPNDLGTWQGHLSTPFRVHVEDSHFVDVELIEVKELQNHGGPREQPFSLLFRTPKINQLPQRMYDVQHETLGEFVLFLVPVLPDEEFNYHESVFN